MTTASTKSPPEQVGFTFHKKTGLIDYKENTDYFESL